MKWLIMWLMNEYKLFYLLLKKRIVSSKIGRKLSRYSKILVDVLCVFDILLMIVVAYWILYFLIFLLITLNIDKDDWLNFVGTLIGGFATMGGVIMTIKYERKRDENNRREQAQPFLVLQASKECSIKDWDGILTISIPDIVVENIGHNIALDISLNVTSFKLSYESGGVNKLSPGATSNISIVLFSSKDIFKASSEDTNDEQISERLRNNMFLFKCLGTEWPAVDQMVSCKGYVVLKYKDLYRHDYNEKFVSRIHIVKKNDEYRCFFECNFLSDNN